MATSPPALPDTACSVVSRALHEPLAGTAATARTWLCVEQPGPWGRDALVESRLDPGVGAELVARSAGTGVRVVLVRRPGRHADAHVPGSRRVFLAHTVPGSARVRSALVADPKELLDLDFAAAGAGELGGFGEPVAGPLLLVCTNGRRDVCCALRGRPVAEELGFEYGRAVWECTHLGGHRFAPTALLLPAGYSYGAVDAAFGRGLLAGGSVVGDRCRGRSTWSAPGQVAELAVRGHAGVADPDALRVGGIVDGVVEVAHVDGRVWRVAVSEVAAPERSVSCGAVPAPVVTWRAHGVRPIA